MNHSFDVAVIGLGPVGATGAALLGGGRAHGGDRAQPQDLRPPARLRARPRGDAGVRGHRRSRGGRAAHRAVHAVGVLRRRRPAHQAARRPAAAVAARLAAEHGVRAAAGGGAAAQARGRGRRDPVRRIDQPRPRRRLRPPAPARQRPGHGEVRGGVRRRDQHGAQAGRHRIRGPGVRPGMAGGRPAGDRARPRPAAAGQHPVLRAVAALHLPCRRRLAPAGS